MHFRDFENCYRKRKKIYFLKGVSDIFGGYGNKMATKQNKTFRGPRLMANENLPFCLGSAIENLVIMATISPKKRLPPYFSQNCRSFVVFFKVRSTCP